MDVNLNAGADPLSDLQSGIIPRAVQMLWKTAEDLVEQGWRYSFEGQILEIVSETTHEFFEILFWISF